MELIVRYRVKSSRLHEILSANMLSFLTRKSLQISGFEAALKLFIMIEQAPIILI